MNVFDTHARIVGDYSSYIKSFINIADDKIREKVDAELKAGKLWPEPLLQFNPAYQLASGIEGTVRSGLVPKRDLRLDRGHFRNDTRLESVDGIRAFRVFGDIAQGSLPFDPEGPRS